jgi:PncC family amidohydrolase
MMDKTLTPAAHVHDFFRKEHLTLAVAESCTGGLISHWITALPGASTFFKTGVIAYSADSKVNILGIDGETLSTYGAVSAETARDMAEKIRKLAATDFSLSTTGNLGPEALEEKDKGLIYIAVCFTGGTFSKELRLKGDRTRNKEHAARKALEFLVEKAAEVRADTRNA